MADLDASTPCDAPTAREGAIEFEDMAEPLKADAGAVPFSSLPEDVLVAVLSQTEAGDLASCQATCRSLRQTVARHDFWKRQCYKKAPSLTLFREGSVKESVLPATCCHLSAASPEDWRNFLYRALCSRICAPPAPYSLIADVLSVSSVDLQEEGPRNVLSPHDRYSRSWRICYWSSQGSEEQDSDEAITFQLAHPVCLISEIQIRPFKTYFQQGKPIYAAKAVRFSLGCADCFDHSTNEPPPRASTQASVTAATSLCDTQGPSSAMPSAAVHPVAASGVQAPTAAHADLPPDAEHAAAPAGTAAAGMGPAGGGLLPPESDAMQERLQSCGRWLWTSEVFPMEHSDKLQSFRIPPTLCIGGHLQVEFLGHAQMQKDDELWYTCISYVRVIGAPLYDFTATRCAAPARPAQQAQQPQRAQQGGVAGPSSGSCSGQAANLSAAAYDQQMLAAIPGIREDVQPHAQRPGEAPGGISGDANSPGWMLRMVQHDPLVSAGGLVSVSERGRLKDAPDDDLSGWDHTAWDAMHGYHSGSDTD